MQGNPYLPSSPHSRRTHTCYPVSRTPSKERPHSLACPHKATSTQPIRHGTYCIFLLCCLFMMFYYGRSVSRKRATSPFLHFVGFSTPPPQEGMVVLYIRSLIPLMGDRYAQRRRKTPAKPLRCVTVHVLHVVNA